MAVQRPISWKILIKDTIRFCCVPQLVSGWKHYEKQVQQHQSVW